MPTLVQLHQFQGASEGSILATNANQNPFYLPKGGNNTFLGVDSLGDLKFIDQPVHKFTITGNDNNIQTVNSDDSLRVVGDGTEVETTITSPDTITISLTNEIMRDWRLSADAGNTLTIANNGSINVDGRDGLYSSTTGSNTLQIGLDQDGALKGLLNLNAGNLYYSNGTEIVPLPAGIDGQWLKLDGNAPAWEDAPTVATGSYEYSDGSNTESADFGDTIVFNGEGINESVTKVATQLNVDLDIDQVTRTYRQGSGITVGTTTIVLPDTPNINLPVVVTLNGLVQTIDAAGEVALSGNTLVFDEAFDSTDNVVTVTYYKS